MAVIKKEVHIKNLQSEVANAYRNMHRPKVDKFFSIKLRSTGKKRKKFDFLARQLWRKILLHANTL